MSTSYYFTGGRATRLLLLMGFDLIASTYLLAEYVCMR